MQRVQGRNISHSAVELKVEFWKHWKNNQSVTALRCRSSELSKLARESFLFEVAAQAGRWRGWMEVWPWKPRSLLQAEVMSSMECPWTCPSRRTQRVTAIQEPSRSCCLPQESPAGNPGITGALQSGIFALNPLAGLGTSDEHLMSPHPLCGGQGQFQPSPKPVGGRKLQILEGILIYSPN